MINESKKQRHVSHLEDETVKSFGNEWEKFPQDRDEEEKKLIFERYFSGFPWSKLKSDSIGFDMGCGSGRWAEFVAPNVGKLWCVDASDKALQVAKKNLTDVENVAFIQGSVGEKIFDAETMDFGYSLGVLHHVPDTVGGLTQCVEYLKKDAPFLIYLYSALEHRPNWYRFVWKMSDLFRIGISRCPEKGKSVICDFLAGTVYWPLARFSMICKKKGIEVENFPLAYYRNMSFYRMRNDSRDRFGTKLEKRYTKNDVTKLMEEAGLYEISFREGTPYWCAVGYKK